MPPSDPTWFPPDEQNPYAPPRADVELEPVSFDPMPMRFSIGDVLSRTWEIYRDRMGICIGVIDGCIAINYAGTCGFLSRCSRSPSPRTRSGSRGCLASSAIVAAFLIRDLAQHRAVARDARHRPGARSDHRRPLRRRPVPRTHDPRGNPVRPGDAGRGGSGSNRGRDHLRAVDGRGAREPGRRDRPHVFGGLCRLHRRALRGAAALAVHLPRGRSRRRGARLAPRLVPHHPGPRRRPLRHLPDDRPDQHPRDAGLRRWGFLHHALPRAPERRRLSGSDGPGRRRPLCEGRAAGRPGAAL